MALFWMATCEPDYPLAAVDPAAEPIMTARPRTLAIEVLADEQLEEFAILFSAADSNDYPTELACCIGFVTEAKACCVWRDRGFPLVDAQIEYRNRTLYVRSPFFVDEDASMQYGEQLLAIEGVDFAKSPSSPKGWATRYSQFEQAPDSGLPASLIQRKKVIWDGQRTYVKKESTPAITLAVTASRYPSLAPLKSGALVVKNAWSGVVSLPSTRAFPTKEVQRLSRADTFGVPAFRFEDVEVLGFRIDLDRNVQDLDRKLAALIEPLNFHLEGANSDHAQPGQNALTDFLYRPATRTVVIELLRYGSMKLKHPRWPLKRADFQSQHELVVRVLVGRVDDDTAQARAPALYVPAIFVDNPWSKAVGRDMQGFDKRMADFCIQQPDGSYTRLRPDGRVPGSAAAPQDDQVVELARISRIDLVGNAGVPNGETILELDCAPEKFDNWNSFAKVDLELALGSTSLAATRWRQSDFEDPEFRRSFARAAVRGTREGFNSVQVSPVGDRDLAKIWITGKFTVDDGLRIARPAGVANITLHASPVAPKGWSILCDILGIDSGESDSLSFPMGSWYRLKFSMDLTIDNGLDWSSGTS